jgi:endonuclease/exonuclease/phosphatase family metal-dependent hydrolase
MRDCRPTHHGGRGYARPRVVARALGPLTPIRRPAVDSHGPRVLVRSWNLYHGNSSPPQRRGFLNEMIACATADGPDVLCVQEVPAWALDRFTVGDLASRPPLGTEAGRVLTAAHHGIMLGGVAGQGIGIWLADASQLRDHYVYSLNPRAYRARRARLLGLDRATRWTWAKEARIVQVVRLRIDGRHFLIANTHCTGYAGDSRIPDDELLAAARFTESVARPDEVVVLAGDFNLRPERSRALAVLTGPARPYSAPGPGIDHILVRGAAASGLRIWPEQRRRTVEGTLLSDHAPVELTVMTGSAFGRQHGSA